MTWRDKLDLFPIWVYFLLACVLCFFVVAVFIMIAKYLQDKWEGL